MTSANVFQWMTANAGQAFRTNLAAGQAKSDHSADLGVFASMLGIGSLPVSGDAGTVDRKPDVGMCTASTEAYGRYQYREPEISCAKQQKFADGLEDANEELDAFRQQVIRSVSEKLEVPEEEVLRAMEALGISVFDLMDPGRLVPLALELTEAENASGLLTNPGFMELMQEVGTLGNQLMETLKLPAEQQDELIAQLDVKLQNANEPEAVPKPEQVIEPEGKAPGEAAAEQKAKPEPAEFTVAEEYSQPDELKLSIPKEASEKLSAEEVSVSAEEADDVSAEVSGQAQGQPETDTRADDGQTEEKMADGGGKQRETPHMGEQKKTDGPVVAGAQVNAQDFRTVPIEEMAGAKSYQTIDVADIIEQIAEKVKVSISEETSSIEMQLNPEQLGKVYLQVTAKEGAVHAQLTAVNEAVRSALEVQMAELKESLNQAGVKVDAIEVTVASHEFEQNLEQGARQEEQNGEQAESRSHRRSIRLDSLDELAGVMTEEEVLVAQIMRDNGNTMDLSA